MSWPGPFLSWLLTVPRYSVTICRFMCLFLTLFLFIPHSCSIFSECDYVFIFILFGFIVALTMFNFSLFLYSEYYWFRQSISNISFVPFYNLTPVDFPIHLSALIIYLPYQENIIDPGNHCESDHVVGCKNRFREILFLVFQTDFTIQENPCV